MRSQDLERLKLMEDLERLKFSNISYQDYKYQEGDVVYCDIPYENTCGYAIGDFDQKAFVEWALSRDYPVYISSLWKWSYKDKFYLVWGKDINSTFSAQTNTTEQCEILVCNKPPKEKYNYCKQLKLF